MLVWETDTVRRHATNVRRPGFFGLRYVPVREVCRSADIPPNEIRAPNQSMQAPELSLQHAIAEAPAASERLRALAAKHRAHHTEVNLHETVRHWEPSAGTFCYQTHIAIDGQTPERLDWLTDVFFNAATLSSQPWYPQFLGGEVQPLGIPTAAGIEKQQLTLGRFNLGLPTSRYYRQLVSVANPDDATWVIVARSVPEGPELPNNARLAYTLDPNGEVLHFENGRLYWHHICCTPGAGVLPGRLDRLLINALRRTGLDRVERRTYQEEAEQLRDWLSGPAIELPG